VNSRLMFTFSFPSPSARSPIYTHLAATLNGLSTIRAFDAENALALEFDNHQDLNSSAALMFLDSSKALGFWLDITLVIYLTMVVLSFIIEGNSGGNVGLVITQVMSLAVIVQR